MKVFNVWHHVAAFAAARDVASLTTMSSKFRAAAAGLWARHSAATAPLKGWSHALEGHRRAVNCLAAVGDTMIASGAADGTIRLWCTGSGAEIGVMEGHDDFVYCLLAVPELDLVASGSKDASVHVWSTVDNGLVFRFKGHAQSVSALARVCDDGLASASHDHDVRIWSLRTSRRIKRGPRRLKGTATNTLTPEGDVGAWGRGGQRDNVIGWGVFLKPGAGKGGGHRRVGGSLYV